MTPLKEARPMPPPADFLRSHPSVQAGGEAAALAAFSESERSRATMMLSRRLPVGAEIQPGEGTHFRVWAPQRRKVEVVLESDGSPSGVQASAVELSPEESGYWSVLAPSARGGTLYRFRLDGERALYPDPASRFQPQGVHGPSQVVDPHTFRWTDAAWRGVPRDGQVIYEMHVGTFTPEGTWAAAQHELPELAALGVTVLEIMPIAEFPGRFGWGYDGVDLFAPTRLYGTPDDFRAFVDKAHTVGLGVILDVVYNHVGPDGNYLTQFSAEYFTDRHHNEWGQAINFDGDNAGPVRDFFLANAQYWIEEFHLDGLRLDATQQIFDASEEHILAAIARRARRTAGDRRIFLTAENEPQEAVLARPIDQGGCGIDCLWNDDFHHAAMVALTGHREAYYTDYFGSPQEFISAAKRGFLYQGQRYEWQKKRRGKPALDLSPAQFVTFLQNHDQVANSGSGRRIHALSGPGPFRALTALWLLGPGTPLFFQGQEFASSTPFFYFADHPNEELGAKVRQGRLKFLSQFPSVATNEVQERIPDPGDVATFVRCKLDLGERGTHADIYALHRDLLRLRREDTVLGSQQPGGVDGAVLAAQAFVLRFFSSDGVDRLLIVNLGGDLRLDPAPEPLLAPPEAGRWDLLWSSEDPRYGGRGTPPVETSEGWRIPGQCAVVLIPTMLE
jgi:maltooligosyltrehalose trehalohydrolase